VVEFAITHDHPDGGQTTNQRIRLVTTLPDPDHASPAEMRSSRSTANGRGQLW
jgi:hypothetical protein